MRCDLENDAALVELAEHRRDLPLPECVVEGVVDELRRHPEAPDHVAIELEQQPWRGGLEVAGHVLQLRQRRKLFQDDGSPLEQLRDIGVLQRVLVLRLAHARPDLDVLAGLPEQRNRGDLGGRAAQPADDLGSTRVAQRQRLEIDHQAPGIHRRVGPDPVIDGVDVGIGGHHVGELVHAPDHGSVRNVLRGFGRALDGAVVLLREEALGDEDVEPRRRRHRRRHDEKHEDAVAQRPAQRHGIDVERVLKPRLEPRHEAALAPAAFRGP